jgi:hypothetical protein
MLFLAVLLGVRLRCLLSVPMGVKLVGARCEGMMCRFLVMSGLICFDRFPMVSGGVRAMFCCLLVKFRKFRHSIPPMFFNFHTLKTVQRRKRLTLIRIKERSDNFVSIDAMLVQTPEGKYPVYDALVLCIDRHRTQGECIYVTIYLLTEEQITGVVEESEPPDDFEPRMAA